MDDFKQQIIDLWRISFPEDTEEFIRLHFDQKYKEENTLVARQGNTVVSVLQMMPYKMTFYEEKIDASYISGACTHPSLQSNGYMFRLLSDSFMEMYRRGVALTALIPASERVSHYYGKAGYTFVFDYSQEHYPVSSLLGKNKTTSKYVTSEWDSSGLDDIYLYFTEKEHKRPFCIQHTKEEFSAVLEDLYNDNGTLFYIKNNFDRRICGLMFVVPSEDRILIKEFFYDGEGEKHLLLQAIAKKYDDTKEIICAIPPYPGSFFHLGMARVVNAEYLLSLYAKTFPEKEFTLKIKDPVIVANEGIYFIRKGIVSKTTEDILPKNAVEISIDRFTQAILGYHTEQLPDEIAEIFPSSHPYMSLMMD
jgi:predicted acetyltransferase